MGDKKYSFFLHVLPYLMAFDSNPNKMGSYSHLKGNYKWGKVYKVKKKKQSR